MKMSWISEAAETSILDRDKPRPTVIRGDNTSDYTIVAIIIIAMLLFWAWIFFTLYNENPNTKYFLVCDPGKCATNIYNGEKRCPDLETSSLAYDPTFEVCNSRYTCENITTPYALTSNGSTNDFGYCDSGSICRCLNNPQCAYDNMVVFTVDGGTISNFAETGSRARIIQATGEPGYTGSQTLTYPGNTISYCQIKLSHFDRVVPRTDACSFNNNGTTPTLQQYGNCIRSNPCAAGRLAFKPTVAGTFQFNLSAISRIPVGCTPNTDGKGNVGPTCVGGNPGTVPVYDPLIGGIVCK